MLGSYEVIFDKFFEVFIPVMNSVLVPILLWIMLPGLVTQILLKRNGAYTIGAFIGLIGMFTIGPYSNSRFL
ncbi:hypothetical protein M3204_03400 [Mesobacillus subterraneus]|uniref:hypothetical protein n=1 Tax=Mesobacillus subterraneus TaxID=285983 RepID=UPI00203E59D5|nr:hypothetical protein [Mesobacillus subterraneus]MCM3663436.1 hypothetical protein [Mesobacillus subterraneus]MCM3683206.1 hypothetical protein [Mesobacillus subterraneus]